MQPETNWTQSNMQFTAYILAVARSALIQSDRDQASRLAPRELEIHSAAMQATQVDLPERGALAEALTQAILVDRQLRNRSPPVPPRQR